MKQEKQRIVSLLVFTFLILLGMLIMQPLEILGFQEYIEVIFPKGMIAKKQFELLLIIQVIMLLIVLPVFFITYYFTWKYRASNPKAKYDPKFNDHPIAECIWWGAPVLIVAAISYVTWIDTYELDPYKPIPSDKETVEVQAVALQWRWLFLYPQEGIATMNYLQIPVGHPVHFEITADAPMNALWIPALGGMIYAMPKMKTELNLIGDVEGDYRGSSANISGKGFSDMHFVTRVSSEEQYQKWLKSAKETDEKLTFEKYQALAKPTIDTATAVYRFDDETLFTQILDKFLYPKKDG